MSPPFQAVESRGPDAVVSVPAISGVAFLRAVFDLYRSGQVFAITRPDTQDHPALAGAREIHLPDGPKSGWLDLKATPSTSPEPAQIVFSSGTEGQPKAILLSHRALGDVVTRLNRVMGVTAEIREYLGVPVTYSFGLGRARAVAAVGGAVYLPEAFDPQEIRRMLEAGEINAISAVPSLWRLVLRAEALMAPVGDRVRWIEIGSQYMSAEEKRAMRRLFPKAQIVQHYGLTEASRSTFLDISAARDSDLGSVGPVDSPVEIALGPEGQIRIRGDHVALGEVTEEGLVPLTDAEGWLETKDLGEIRDGHLYFLGRLDDQINMSGIKLSAEMLERRVSQVHPGFEGRFAIAAVPDDLRGDVPLVAAEGASTEELDALRAAVVATLAERGIAGADAVRSLAMETLPRTGSDKIQRRALREHYLQTAPETPQAAEASSVAGVFEQHFPAATITSETSLESLGGDSLSYLAVALDLERVLGDLPDNWQSMAIAELETANVKKTAIGRIDMPTFIRALSITLVVVGHFGLLEYGGTGALVLFYVAGMNFAALTVPSVLHRGDVAPIWILAARVTVLTWAFMTVNWIVTGYGNPLSYLMITNWMAVGFEGGIWFMSVYLQLLLVLALPLLSARVRTYLQTDGFGVVAGLALASIALMAVSDALVDTDHLFRRLPHLLGWIFLSGALAHFADTPVRKAVALGIFALGWGLFLQELELRYILLAVPVLIFVPALPVPRLALWPLRMVAGASLLIYLTHFQFQSVVTRLIGEAPAISALAALGGGVALWLLWRPIDNQLRSRLSALAQ